jgi:acetyl-CoA carboxylase carboxyltransferase component
MTTYSQRSVEVTPSQPPSLRDQVASLTELRRQIQAGPSARATEALHARGKLTARERLDLLFDDGTFTEIEAFRRHRATGFGLEQNRPHTDGVIIGWGMVDGRKVFAYAHDFRIFGGSLGEAQATKIVKVMELAESTGAPVVGICDGAGARIQEGVTALAGYGEIFRRNVRMSGVVPQISVVVGSCAGGAAYSPALTDFVFMVRDMAQLFITGPDVVHVVTGEVISHEGLGGADVHARTSGVASFAYDDEVSCFTDVRYLLSLLPANNQEPPPRLVSQDPADRRTDRVLDLVPTAPGQAYDIRTVLEEILDDADLLEIQPNWAENIVCGLGRLGGWVVGIVANQPLQLAGVLDIHASEKAARFVQFCDAFNIPLVTVVDVPGFLPGIDQEHGGIIRHGAKLLYAYCNATVPRIQLILRKAYGGAYIVMDSRSIGADLSLAWPSNEIAVMGAEGAVGIVFRRELHQASDPEATRARRIEEYRSLLMHPYYAAERGLVDDIIDPADTRSALIDALGMLSTKYPEWPRRKHGNQPQ